MGLARIVIGGATFYNPHARQDDFHFCSAPNVLYGGAAGGGKSHALRMDAYIRCLNVPNFRALLLRRTYPELLDTHIEKAIIEASQLGAVYNKSEYKLRFPNGSILQFGHCEDDSTVAKYLSTEYDAIYFDELVTFTLHQFKFISSRARTTKPGLVPCVRAGTNPGGANSFWVRRFFIFKDVPTNDPEDPCNDPSYDPANYDFVPATLDDNPYVDPSYAQRLMSLPSEAMRRAFRYGDWDIFEGQFFSEWAASKDGQPWHVTPELPHIDGRAITGLPWLEVFRALDWGYREPGVCGWYACLPDGRLLKFKEYVFHEMHPAEVARAIRQQSIGMKVRYTVADPAMFMREGAGTLGESMADSFARERVPLTKADNDRINGWQRLHHWLRERTMTANGEIPMLQIYGPGCPYTCRTIPSLVVDDNRPEDVKTKGTEDHAGDETRYAVMSRPTPSRRPKTPLIVPGTMGWEIQKLLRKYGSKPERLGRESVRYTR